MSTDSKPVAAPLDEAMKAVEAYDPLDNWPMKKKRKKAVAMRGDNPVSSLPYSAEEAARDIERATPFVFICPAGCGCLWRDNYDGTMSLFNGNQTSCSVCEFLPLEKLTPLYRGVTA